MIAQKLAARSSTKVAFVGLGASGKDPILVARDGSVLLGLAGKPIKDSKPNPPKRFSETRPSASRRSQVAPSCAISRIEKVARFICMSTSRAT
jgi:hypothetical protein